jgi:hypothetical protein
MLKINLLNGFENYSFQKEGEQTKVLVELDSLDEFAEYMNQTYPNLQLSAVDFP